MQTKVIYTYLGTNGVIESPVFLEGIYFVRKYQLIADIGKWLTNGTKKVTAVVVPENELEQWTEIDA